MRTLHDHEQLIHVPIGRAARRVVNGPAVALVGPGSLERREAVTLGKLDFLRVESALDASVRVEKGPQLFFGKAHDTWGAKEQATILRCDVVLRRRHHALCVVPPVSWQVVAYR
jgi:hypothetical protein